MPRKSYRVLHEQVMARPGAGKRLTQLQQETLAEIALYELRRECDLSQAELANRLSVTQSAISKLEHSDDLHISTLRNYVEALGGTLELRARFEDQSIPIVIGERE